MDYQNLYLGKPLAFQVMIKPFGPVCNLDCRYCYYLEKQNLYKQQKDFRLNEDLLESFIKQHIEAHEVPVVQFVWQGGEPTLLGIDYFRKALRIQQKYAGDKRIENVLQTNGTRLNVDWARFLKQNEFLVGISIDGPEHLHDAYRRTNDDRPTWREVMNGIEVLKRYGVEFNTMTVVNDLNVAYPLEVYHFLKDIGSHYMQFLPVVERVADDLPDDELSLVSPTYKGGAKVAGWSVDPDALSPFLNTIFDEWVRSDVGKYYVQHFDVALANWVGAMSGLCVFSATCGDATCMEHNGDVFSCDHFVYPENLLGNLKTDSLVSLIKSEKQTLFGSAKKDALPMQCVDCEYRFACNGGCPKNRISVTADGEPGLNYLCESYYDFFKHIHPYMQFMAEELKKKRAPANVMQWVRKKDREKAIREGHSLPHYVPPTGKMSAKGEHNKINRNDPCPCGSGKKYKNCCMRVMRSV